MAGVEGLLVAAAVLLGATGFGLWRRRMDGRLRPVADGRAATLGRGGTPVKDVAPTGDVHGRSRVITPSELGTDLGRVATFVSFSTAFCQPCRANRQVLGQLVATTDGVAHVEIDAESRLDLVRGLGVTRTPTTFVLDASGAVRHRANGVLRLAEARATVGSLTDA